MTDAPDSKYLEMFAAWLRSLGQDAAALGEIVKGNGPESARKHSAAGLNYLFKSLDLIPDGIDDLGFLDDAFVLRIAASLAVAEDAKNKTGALEQLANDATAIKEFLGDDYDKLVLYVKNLHKGAARGRTVDDIITDETVRTQFTQEVAQWSRDYQAPTFTRDVKTLIKLKSFLHAKL
jgi:uncharacterized membrane protein YkvA (DUF1232 family)